jgi:hypothetical protein
VACDGIPFGSARNVRSQLSFVSPNVATATQSSAPQITAHRVIVTMSTSTWSLPRSDRGSFSVAKCSLMLVGGNGAIVTSCTALRRQITLAARHLTKQLHAIALRTPGTPARLH